METKLNRNISLLLPNWFKKIGIALCIISFAVPVIIKLTKPELLELHKEPYKLFFSNAFLLGLFFISWAKDKSEDELTIALRLRSLALAFAWAVLYLIISPLADMLFTDAPQPMSATQIMISMHFMFLLAYNFLKMKR